MDLSGDDASCDLDIDLARDESSCDCDCDFIIALDLDFGDNDRPLPRGDRPRGDTRSEVVDREGRGRPRRDGARP